MISNMLAERPWTLASTQQTARAVTIHDPTKPTYCVKRWGLRSPEPSLTTPWFYLQIGNGKEQ